MGLTNYIKSILFSTTFRQSSTTFIATVLNGALGAIFFIVAARYLGPSHYGLFSVAMAVLTLTASIGNLGTDTGIVNFVSRHKTHDKEKAFRFLKLALKIKLVVGICIMLLGVVLSSQIAQLVFGKPELTELLQIAFIGVLAQLLFTFGTSALQSFQRFVEWGAVNVGQNSIRLVFLFIIYAIGAVTTSNILLLYAFIPFAGFMIGMFFLPKAFLKVKDENSVSNDFFKYNMWVAAFSAIAALSSRLDTFIAARLLDTTQIGLYGAANQLVQIVPQFVGALGTVIAPKMAQQNSKEKFIDYLKKSQLMVLGIAFLGICSIPLVLWILPFLFGSEYVSSGPLFVVLLLAMLLFLISVPIHIAVFYYFSYPKLFFWISLGHLIIITLVGWNLISFYGVMGAAWTVLVGQLFNFVVPAMWVFNKIKNK